ncbi:Protein SYM1 [Grifola frondosa]|uniref:Protein SYM1 n=1 Tax=Grifola frondosa TaxID=5627 RepID=A0A1C7MDK8_GRIFR|nr:Protein SYM1 [Grifola frondosa]
MQLPIVLSPSPTAPTLLGLAHIPSLTSIYVGAPTEKIPLSMAGLTQSIQRGAHPQADDHPVFEKKGRDHDIARTARLAFYGGAIFGPIVTKWLQFLNRLQASTPTKTIIYRVYLDQAAFTPCAIGLFFGSLTFLEGKGISDAQQRISEAYTPTLLRNWGVFVPTQIVNFGFVPPHLRFVTVGVVSLFWNCYLSSVNAKTQAEIEDHAKYD